MGDIKDTKRLYYALRGKYAREIRQINAKHMFVTNDEDDALYWAKYLKVMKRWRALENPNGTVRVPNGNFEKQWRWKPEFNEEYKALTLQLKEVYKQLERAESVQEREHFKDCIRTLKEERRACTTYTDRITGEPRPIQ